MNDFLKNSRLSSEQLDNVTGGVLQYQGEELPEELLEKTLEELSEDERFGMLESYKTLLKFMGIWNWTLQQVIDKYGEEKIQALIDKNC